MKRVSDRGSGPPLRFCKRSPPLASCRIAIKNMNLPFSLVQQKSPACAGLAQARHGACLPPVLDPCCGSKMFWFDKSDPRALFCDIRNTRRQLTDKSSKGGYRELIIEPDVQCDFTALPFPDHAFALVVFDPPHLQRNGAHGWVGLKYGTLPRDWREILRVGFAECFRVLRPEGVLIFKWCADEIPLAEILALTPERPLFGHRSGRRQLTHWVCFLKPC